MRLARPAAGHKGREPLDPMRETMLHEEIERPIRHRRLAPDPRRAHTVQQFIGRQRPVRFEQALERKRPRRRQSKPPRPAKIPGSGQRSPLADAVVMGGEGGQICGA